MSQNADADARQERRDERGGVEDREADHPVDHERVEARAQAGRAQLEQDAFRRLGGDDRVENVARGSRRLRP